MIFKDDMHNHVLRKRLDDILEENEKLKPLLVMAKKSIEEHRKTEKHLHKKSKK